MGLVHPRCPQVAADRRCLDETGARRWSTLADEDVPNGKLTEQLPWELAPSISRGAVGSSSGSLGGGRIVGRSSILEYVHGSKTGKRFAASDAEP